MNSLDAVAVVLEQANEPLHYQKITQQIIAQGLWKTAGKTPEATINSNVGKDIRIKGENSRFKRVGSGVYALRQWESDDFLDSGDLAEKTEQLSSKEETARVMEDKPLSFADAAEYILDHHANKQPMHYRAVTEKMLALGLVKTEGLTPEATLYAQILTEIKRQITRGNTPRFVKYGKGFFGLQKWMGQGLAFQIRQQNNQIRKKLLAQLHKITPAEFEELVAQLLVSLGFEDVVITPLQGDNGIDVRGTLVVGNVVRIRMAVQAKRWKKNIHAPVVQQVRGSLGTHDQGLIITTSDFSKGAYDEAQRPDAIPVALMNGEQMVELMIEHEINVKRITYQLVVIDEEDTE